MLVREKDKEKKRHSFSLKSELERALTNAVAKQDLKEKVDDLQVEL